MATGRVLGCVALALSCAACGPGGQHATTQTATSTRAADPAGIDRIRSHLPPDYEMAKLPNPPMPVTFWGFAPGWSADPAVCQSLPAVAADAAPRGWAASGPGGIVYAVVAAAVPPNPEQVDSCATWTMRGGRTTAAVSLDTGPAVSGAQSVAMTADVSTRVENGAETHSHASTLVAYVDALAVSVTVVTDPGSGTAGLPESVPADLLQAAVRAIRGSDGSNR